MNINDWQTIQTRNDIKYIKRVLPLTPSVSWSIIIEIFLVLLSFTLDKCLDPQIEANYIWIIVAATGIVVPIVIVIIGRINTKKKERISKKVINSRELISLFDDEVCYLIMSAKEFYSNFKNAALVNNKQDALLAEFYYIEASYYLNKATTLIVQMKNNLSCVITDDPNCTGKISCGRLANAISIICTMYEDLKNQVRQAETLLQSYGVKIDLEQIKSHEEYITSFVDSCGKSFGIDNYPASDMLS